MNNINVENRILVVPDVHATTVWRDYTEGKMERYNKVIFLGDYFDSFNNDWSKVDQIENLRTIVDLKQRYPDRVVLLVGNHDLHYVCPMVAYQCSGYQHFKSTDIHNFFKENLDAFDIAYEYNGYVFSHAGISQDWCELEHLYSVDVINDVFHQGKYRPFGFEGHGFDTHGNDKTQGPLWIRTEIVNCPRFDKQMVGHTPFRREYAPYHYDKNGYDIWFLDNEDHLAREFVYKDGKYKIVKEIK